MANLVSMAQQFQGLPMNSLIGGPLNASAEANSNMAWTQTMFLLNTCFETSTTTDDSGNESQHYDPIMITMSLDRPVINETSTSSTLPITQATTTFDIPLLTVVPLNSLAVESVDITFEMEVKSSYSDSHSHASSSSSKESGGFKASGGIGPFSVSIHGSASYDHKDSNTHNTHYQKSNSAKYTVNVTAGQLPLPKGINTIIEAYTKAIQPIEVTSGSTSKSKSSNS